MRVLLLDGDTLVYQAGREAERATDWGDGCWTLHAEESDGASALDHLIGRIVDGTNADRVIVALSDYDNPGWRYSVLPTYKQSRSTKKMGNGRPLLWAFLRAHFAKHYETLIRPTLEGDDVLGILATTTNTSLIPAGSERIIASIDKDMQTLPAHHLNFTRSATAFGWEVTTTTLADADRFHLFQTLTGDATDGYKGCPGVGPVAANKILDPFTYDDDFDVAGAWQAVVQAYEKAKLTEDDALVQARVARICRASDYNFNDKSVILWTPPTA
jgi:DNA polymerase I